MLETHPLENAQSPFFEEAWQLYADAFPEPERHSRAWLAATVGREPTFHAWALAEAGHLAALLFFWQVHGFVYVEHLAVVLGRRGGGLGQEALSLLPEGIPVILEIEPVVDALTQRRLRFYQHAGFARLPYPHCQPPYHPGQAPLPMELLGRGAVGEPLWRQFEAWLAEEMAKALTYEAESIKLGGS